MAFFVSADCLLSGFLIFRYRSVFVLSSVSVNRSAGTESPSDGPETGPGPQVLCQRLSDY